MWFYVVGIQIFFFLSRSALNMFQFLSFLKSFFSVQLFSLFTCSSSFFLQLHFIFAKKNEGIFQVKNAEKHCVRLMVSSFCSRVNCYFWILSKYSCLWKIIHKLIIANYFNFSFPFFISHYRQNGAARWAWSERNWLKWMWNSMNTEIKKKIKIIAKEFEKMNEK